MEAHQQRVVAEKAELDEKIAKLQAFTTTQTFVTVDAEEQERLLRQLAIMRDYSAILEERIKHFK